MEINRKAITISAFTILLYRAGFSTIIFLSASEVNSKWLQYTLLLIFALMVTTALNRFVKMLSFARNAKLVEELYK